MFESDTRKNLKNKYNKMTWISENIGKSKFLKNNESNKNNIEKNSVYGELKLSDKLTDEL
jgi:hypothetical protein